MQVFKAYFKVIVKNIPNMSIYLGVFLFFSVILTMVSFPEPSLLFSESKTRIAIIQEDTGNALSADLEKYMAERAQVVELANNDEVLRDALFIRQVEYILRIPKGFGQSILDSNYNIKLIKTVVPDSTTAIQLDLLIDRYINTAALYADSVPGITPADLTSHVRSDMAEESTVTMHVAAPNGMTIKGTYSFIYLAYTIMAVVFLGVTSMMMAFNNKDIQKRNFSSPVRINSYNLQLLLGNLLFSLIVWVLMVGMSLIISGPVGNLQTVLLLCLNALIFTLACLCISFLIGNFIKNRGVQQAVANVYALGTSFISGVFIPQYMLSQTVQNIASFTPSYWYIRNISEITGSANPGTIGLQMLIVFGFAVAATAVSLVVSKQRRQLQVA